MIIKPESRQQNVKIFLREPLARISTQLSTAAADPPVFSGAFVFPADEVHGIHHVHKRLKILVNLGALVTGGLPQAEVGKTLCIQTIEPVIRLRIVQHDGGFPGDL
jgi:hypothetical protein